MPRPCGVPTKQHECEDPKNNELGDGFCTVHSEEWRTSAEFRAAMKDDAVAVAASLRAPTLLRTALRPFKKRWMKRLASELDGEEA